MSFHRNLRGQDLHSPSSELVENNTGSTILKLHVVKFVGVGTYPQIQPVSTGDVVRGVTQADVLTGQNTYITSLGFMFAQNTNAWNVGNKLYAGAGGSLSLTMSGLPVAYVLKKDPVNGILYIANTGVSNDDVVAAGFPASAELEMTWAVAYPVTYKEFVYNGTGDIVDYNVYSDNTKTLQVFNKHFSYDISGNLTVIVTTNLITSAAKTKTLAYDLAGEMISMTES